MNPYRENVRQPRDDGRPEWLDRWFTELAQAVEELKAQKRENKTLSDMSPYRNAPRRNDKDIEEQELDDHIELSEWLLALKPWHLRLFEDEGLVRYCKAVKRFYEERQAIR